VHCRLQSFSTCSRSMFTGLRPDRGRFPPLIAVSSRSPGFLLEDPQLG
jgi:hypothetical protein